MLGKETTMRPIALFLIITTAGVAGAQVPPPTPPRPTPAVQPYYDFQVERTATRKDSIAPEYPAVLKASGTEGRVVAQFVVDTAGVADLESLRIVSSTHELFSMAVRRVMPQLRFEPAVIGGRKVRQLVQMPFPFTL
jgi:TonB family protein